MSGRDVAKQAVLRQFTTLHRPAVPHDALCHDCRGRASKSESAHLSSPLSSMSLALIAPLTSSNHSSSSSSKASGRINRNVSTVHYIAPAKAACGVYPASSHTHRASRLSNPCPLQRVAPDSPCPFSLVALSCFGSCYASCVDPKILLLSLRLLP